MENESTCVLNWTKNYTMGKQLKKLHHICKNHQEDCKKMAIMLKNAEFQKAVKKTEICFANIKHLDKQVTNNQCSAQKFQDCMLEIQSDLIFANMAILLLFDEKQPVIRQLVDSYHNI